MTAIKGQTRIWSRSPYIIDCVATSGDIVSADIIVRIQDGSRNASVNPTTLKSYTLSKSDVVDDLIRFDISPLVADYIEHSAATLDDTDIQPGQTNCCHFVKVVKSVVDTSGTIDTTGYYVSVDGYSSFMDGLNYAPSTDATGNYGSPAWTPSVAKGTARTIAATDCYRQIGQESYAVVGFYMGEFDEDNTDQLTYGRVHFGPGTNWKTYTQATNKADYSIVASDSRLGNQRRAFQYIPIGKNNMGGNWLSGYSYLEVAHVLRRTDTAAGKPTQTFQFLPPNVSEAGSGANLIINMIQLAGYSEGLLDPSPGETYVISFPAFLDCAVSWPATDVTASYQSYVGEVLTLSIPALNQTMVDCFVDTTAEVTAASVDLPIISTSNDQAVVNDNPVLRYEIICEPKHNVIDCLFINKWGAWDSFSFLKKSVQSLKFESKKYNNALLDVSGGVSTYATTNNATTRYDVNARRSIVVNTGYVNESFNLLLQEIMMSTRILLVINDVFYPVNIVTDSIELKTSLNDKLINYTVEFEFAYDENNNVV